MLKRIWYKINLFFDAFNLAARQFKNQYAFEVMKVSTCSKTHQHKLEIKIIGKGQCVYYSVEEIVADNNFLIKFSPADIRTITYLAACGRFEAILEKEKITKSYEIIRSGNRKGQKTIQLKDKYTHEHIIVSLKDFGSSDLIDKLNSQDAYSIGYLAGQEQTWKDTARIKLIVNSQESLTPNE